MKQNIIHIGLDVDDTQYHGAAFNKETGEVVDFKSRPTLKGLLQQLDRMARHFKGYKIMLCYEASYIGYCLLLAGKHPNKVKVACAREMLGFVWESLNQAAA